MSQGGQQEQSGGTWPMVKFAFQLVWDGKEMLFQEVSGLNSETQVVEYRGGSSEIHSTVKMPGIQKLGHVTLKKGLFKGDRSLWESFNQIKMNTVKRSMVTINLLDESNAVVMSWKLINAFPTKITLGDMPSDTDEVAIEMMELVHEGLVGG